MSLDHSQTFDAESLFQANLPLVDYVVRNVCRGTRIRNPHDVDDFAASVKVALLENDYAILRRWQQRACLAGYLNVVVRRMLSGQRVHEMGRWRPSAEATRCGDAAILLETLMVRDRVAFDQASASVQQLHPTVTREELAAMAERFPQRSVRLRVVELDEAVEVATPEHDRADRRVLDAESRRLSHRASEVVRNEISAWSVEDAKILRLRFASSMSVADIARVLNIQQRPLYRRIEALLARLRATLQAAGVDAAALAGVIGEAADELDFGLVPVAA